MRLEHISFPAISDSIIIILPLLYMLLAEFEISMADFDPFGGWEISVSYEQQGLHCLDFFACVTADQIGRTMLFVFLEKLKALPSEVISLEKLTDVAAGFSFCPSLGPISGPISRFSLS